MRKLRKLHLYVGCLFAPALAFFIVSGTWQTFHLNDIKKDGSYKPPAWMTALSDVHIQQRAAGTPKHASQAFRIFVLAMAGFLLVTTSVGILMALQAASSPWVVWSCLLAGIILPVLLIWFG